jgi:hypothetical protein
MKKVYACGSFRFTREMEELDRILEEQNIEHQVAKTKDSQGILGCLKKIDDSNIIYIVNPGGYVGNSVCIDIGYAYRKKQADLCPASPRRRTSNEPCARNALL